MDLLRRDWKNLRPFTEIECHGFPIDKVVATQKIYTVVVPLAAACHAHVGSNHQIAFAIVGAGYIGVARAAFYTGMFARAEYGIAIYKIGEIQAVAAKGISGPLSPFTHVTIEITVV